MEIAGVGTDVVEVATVANARFKKRLAEYFLTKKEIALVPQNSRVSEYLASRFAAKEAVIKAVPEKLSPHDFAVLKKGARPYIAFSAKKHAKRYTVHISLSHTTHIATAFAIALTNAS